MIKVHTLDHCEFCDEQAYILAELTVFSFPEDHWRRIRTVISLERVCLEIRQRTRVAGVFSNEAS